MLTMISLLQKSAKKPPFAARLTENDHINPKPDGTGGEGSNRDSNKSPCRSRRQLALFLFDTGSRPAEIGNALKIKKATLFRYYQQWKKKPPFFEYQYREARKCFRRIGNGGRRQVASFLARQLGTSEEELLQQMEKPWAIKQIVTGEWKQWPVQRTSEKPRTAPDQLKELLLSRFYGREVREIVDIAMGRDSGSDEDK